MDYADFISGRIAELRTQKGVSARDMSLALGQSESYINKIENKRTLPSLNGLFYICEYFSITPMAFFDMSAASPADTVRLLNEIKKLTPDQTEHIFALVQDLNDKRET
ncbi:MAG: helix-turn-helix transcriptional regulator [Clostridia bacterium]|nr:helix-turn-helix transcriptional regulator [Clostridia bacterium]